MMGEPILFPFYFALSPFDKHYVNEVYVEKRFFYLSTPVGEVATN